MMKNQKKIIFRICLAYKLYNSNLEMVNSNNICLYHFIDKKPSSTVNIKA